MGVLIEGFSILIRVESILTKWPGGWDSFYKELPNQTHCTDEVLMRIGFMAMPDVLAFVTFLEYNGLAEANGDEVEGDFVLMSQIHGARKPVRWLECSNFSINDDPTKVVRVCRQRGDTRNSFAAPMDWQFERSLSDLGKDAYYTVEQTKERMVRLGRENGLDVYQDIATGKRLYLGRTGPDKDKSANE